MARKGSGKHKTLMQEVRNLLQSHRKIEAVGLYMRESNCSLADAKRVVDAEEKNLGPEDQVIPNNDLVELRQNIYKEQYPTFELGRKGPPCLMEEWAVSHSSNSPVFDGCQEKHFADCTVKYEGPDFVVLDIHVRAPEWFRSLNDEQRRCLLVSLIVQLGLGNVTVLCNEDALGDSWEFPPA